MKTVKTLFLATRALSASSGHSITEKLFRGRKANYDLEYLRNLSAEDLVYRVVRLQRIVDSYHSAHHPSLFDGRDKLRVDHPSVADVITESTLLRKVVFKVLYVGWEYSSYSWEHASTSTNSQQGTNAVERVFLEALLRQQLIPGPRSTLSRAGRTDQSVSGAGQAIAATVRSKRRNGFGVWDNAAIEEPQLAISDRSEDHLEVPYVKLLNQALPGDIRVLAWSPVGPDFSARHHCRSRSYKYFFLRGKADIGLMDETAKKFIGNHDFRHFCKKNSQNIFKHYVRDLLSFDVKVVSRRVVSRAGESAFDVCVAEVEGRSFTYKQIRCMTSILLKVGMRDLPPSIVDRMLDVRANPDKPDYGTLNPANLLLCDVTYDDGDVSWRWDDDALAAAADSLAHRLVDQSAKSEVLKQMLGDVTSRMTSQSDRAEAASLLYRGMFGHRDVHFGVREKTNSLEVKREKGRRRLVAAQMNKGFYRNARHLQLENENES